MGGRMALPETSTPCHPTVQRPNEKWSSREGTYSVLTAQSFPVVQLKSLCFHVAGPCHPGPDHDDGPWALLQFHMPTVKISALGVGSPSRRRSSSDHRAKGSQASQDSTEVSIGH